MPPRDRPQDAISEASDEPARWDDGRLTKQEMDIMMDMDRMEIMRLEGDMLRSKQEQLDERVAVLEHIADSMIDDRQLSEVVSSLDPDQDGMMGERDFGDKFLATPFLPTDCGLDNYTIYVERDQVEEREDQLAKVGRGMGGHPWLLWLACKDQNDFKKVKKAITGKSWRNTDAWMDEEDPIGDSGLAVGAAR